MRCCRSPFGVTTGRGDGGAVGREFAPAGDLLSFAPPKESRQRKGGPTGRVPFGATCDARARGGAAELALFASLSPLKQRQRVSSRSAHASLRARPTPCASRHGQKGFEDRTRAIAALGLGLNQRAAASRGSFYSLSLWQRVGVRATHDGRRFGNEYAASACQSSASCYQKNRNRMRITRWPAAPGAAQSAPAPAPARCPPACPARSGCRAG